MGDIVQFLRHRLAEDEQTARDALHSDAVSPGEWVTEHRTDDDTCHIAEDRTGNYWSVAHDVYVPNAEHIARQDPARTLRRVAAYRAILDHFEGATDAWYHEDAVLKPLAAEWSDHPDYDQSWSVTA